MTSVPASTVLEPRGRSHASTRASATHAEARVLVLKSDGLSEQLGAVQEIEGVLCALHVLEHDEGEVLLLLGLPVPGNVDPLEGPGVQEQLVQDLLVHLIQG